MNAIERAIEQERHHGWMAHQCGKFEESAQSDLRVQELCLEREALFAEEQAILARHQAWTQAAPTTAPMFAALGMDEHVGPGRFIFDEHPDGTTTRRPL